MDRKIDNEERKKEQLNEPLMEQSTLLNFYLPPSPTVVVARVGVCFHKSQKGCEKEISSKRKSLPLMVHEKKERKTFHSNFHQSIFAFFLSSVKWKNHVTNCFSIVFPILQFSFFTFRL